MPRRPDMPCAVCGSLMWRGTSSLPEGQAMCRPCRRVVVADRTKYTGRCVDCDGPCWATRCRTCYDLRVKALADPESATQRKRERAIRQRRDRAAPGLTLHQRRNLGAKWRKQGRSCTYCDALATQVDHVIPLALGGTNYEGNLTPCCASCNVRKSDSLLIEWKWKVRVKRTHPEPPPQMKRGPDYSRRVCKVYFTTCVCGLLLTTRASNQRFCSKACNDRAYNQANRPAACPRGTLRPCSDCAEILVVAPAHQCEACREVKRRAAKRRARQNWKRNRRARDRAQRQQAA